MKHKTLFRLGLKLLDVYFIAEGISNFVYFVAAMASIEGVNSLALEDFAATTISMFFQVCVGLYLFFNGKWIVDLAIPSNRPYCPECAYDLRGDSAERCPECGTPIDMVKLRPPDSIA